MLNHIVVMGRLTRDPELRKTASGVSVASFSVAVDRDFSQQDGKKETDFLDVVAWRNTAEFAAKYFTKGRMAVVSGRLQIRNWEDKEGNKRRTAEILAENIYFGDSKKEDDGGSAPAPTQGLRCACTVGRLYAQLRQRPARQLCAELRRRLLSAYGAEYQCVQGCV